MGRSRGIISTRARVVRDCMGGYRSGQTGLTVNQLALPSEVRILHRPPVTCQRLFAGPCGAGVAHSLGKTEVMGSNPITGSALVDSSSYPSHCIVQPGRRCGLFGLFPCHRWSSGWRQTTHPVLAGAALSRARLKCKFEEAFSLSWRSRNLCGRSRM
jgi:hypothetical protein